MSGVETQGKLGLYTLAWPIFVEQLLRLMLGYVSVFMLGHYSDEAVAATGVANQILAISVIFYGFLTVGVQIVVSQLIGAKRFKRVERVITNGLVVAFLIGVIMSLVFVLFGDSFLRMLGLSQQLVAVGSPFIRIIGGISVVIALYSSILPILRTHGFVRQAMLVPITVSVVNMVLNYLFLYGKLSFLGLGVTGVGIAVGIANVIGMLMSAWMLKKIHWLCFPLAEVAAMLTQNARGYFTLWPAVGGGKSFLCRITVSGDGDYCVSRHRSADHQSLRINH